MADRENLYEFEKAHENRFGGFINCFPTKSLIDKPDWKEEMSKGRDIVKDAPWWMVIGPSVQGVLEEFPQCR